MLDPASQAKVGSGSQAVINDVVGWKGTNSGIAVIQFNNCASEPGLEDETAYFLI